MGIVFLSRVRVGSVRPRGMLVVALYILCTTVKLCNYERPLRLALTLKLLLFFLARLTIADLL